MMPFDAQLMHFPTITAFAAHLQGVPRPAWVKGITNHNSYQPDETNWAGMRSMEAMRDYYRDVKKWDSGPHLFLAAHAPNPADTGIFSMTPLTHPGTHAGACNATRIGVESVGNFDRAPPSAEQYTLLITINLLILHHWGIPPSAVNVHRDCMPGRTCPGKHLTSTQIRDTLNTTWPRPPTPRPSPYEKWGDVGRPVGEAETYAIPRAWLVNKKLGKCIAPEDYSKSGKYSIAEFENGTIQYLVARKTTIIEMF